MNSIAKFLFTGKAFAPTMFVYGAVLGHGRVLP